MLGSQPEAQNGVEAVLITKPASCNTGAGKAQTEGVLTLTTKRLRWQPNNAAAAQPISLQTSSIVSQQKAVGKPFLRLVTAARPYVFQLATSADVEAVVPVLAPLLSKPTGGDADAAARTASSAPALSAADAALRKKLLDENQELKALYAQLVDGGVLQPKEFWQGQQALLRSEAGRQATAQRAGLSSAMLGDVQRNADGQSERVRFRLTPQLIHQTFAEKPAVRRAFTANVPHNMDEKAFWTKYLRLQLKEQKRREHAGAGGAAEEVDDEDAEFFARYERAEDSAAVAAPAGRRAAVDPTVDLAADQNDSLSGGFGIGHDPRKEPSVQPASGGRLIHELNRHAAVVMEPLPANMADDAATAAAELEKARKAAMADPRALDPAAAAAGFQDSHRRGGSGLDDLRVVRDDGFSKLTIQDPRRYFDAAAGSVPAQQAIGDRTQAARSMLQALSRINPAALAQPLLPPNLAAKVLHDVTRDSAAGVEADAITGGPSAADPAGMLPHLLELQRQTALMVNELLRHFWGCFPVGNIRPRLDKLQRVHKGLSEQYDKIQHMIQAASSGTERVQVTQLMRPVLAALDAAFAKYESDQAHRREAAAQ